DETPADSDRYGPPAFTHRSPPPRSLFTTLFLHPSSRHLPLSLFASFLPSATEINQELMKHAAGSISGVWRPHEDSLNGISCRQANGTDKEQQHRRERENWGEEEEQEMKTGVWQCLIHVLSEALTLIPLPAGPPQAGYEGPEWEMQMLPQSNGSLPVS
ncbi:hypothetical protein KUCAC02_002811, partial [Chaenocephalus aceratus]